MLNEADTRAKLIDPAIYNCGWSEEHISREATLGPVEAVDLLTTGVDVPGVRKIASLR
jgi:type I site-specific restriction endonuclease